MTEFGDELDLHFLYSRIRVILCIVKMEVILASTFFYLGYLHYGVYRFPTRIQVWHPSAPSILILDNIAP